MSINIDPSFSVYGLVERAQKITPTSILYSRATMNQISHQIENATLIDGAKTRFFSSFQFLSRFIPQVERYRQIAETAESVYVFGIDDMQGNLPHIPNLTYVKLDRYDQIAKEWFLVSYNDRFASVLATEEISDMDSPDAERQFKGVWTFDIEMAQILNNWLTSMVGGRELKGQRDKHDYRAQTILVNNIMKRMTDHLTKYQGKSPMTDTQEQIRLVIENTLRPAATA
jgi:DICT domain-containing protein